MSKNKLKSFICFFQEVYIFTFVYRVYTLKNTGGVDLTFQVEHKRKSQQ